MALFEKPLFIFEMANNHQGNVNHGKQIIQELSRVTEKYMPYFDFAVKFQYRDLDTFIRPDYINRDDIKNVKRFKDTRLDQEQFRELKAEVERQGMRTICTPFDEASVEMIAEHRYEIIKIASCSFTDWPLLEKISETRLPVIASTAGCDLEDIDKVVMFFKHRRILLALMHCIAEYPTLDEHLQMNQITLLKTRYPGIHIGFSTHEDPANMEPVKVAVAKGAEIFEKHVGVVTDTIQLNSYSATPEQVGEWLDAAFRVYTMCGVSGKRYESSQKEKADLAALQRGVFANKNLQPGCKIDKGNVYFAFPCESGQLLTRHFSKYASIIGSKKICANDPIKAVDVFISDSTERIRKIVGKIMTLLKKSNVVVPVNSTCHISHHYGIDRYEEIGTTLIDCINREYCKKLMVMLPGQRHPVHLHKEKEETFIVLYGTLDVVCDGKEFCVKQGESMIVERGVNHSFSSKVGCVFEEISTTHYINDSYYEVYDEFVDPRKTTVYITNDMLKNLKIKN